MHIWYSHVTSRQNTLKFKLVYSYVVVYKPQPADHKFIF